MRKVLYTVLIVLFALPVIAADVILTWDVSGTATGYKIYKSTDNGVTWDSGTDVKNVLTYTLTDQADSGLILYKISAYNDNGSGMRSWSGAWYNGSWRPPENTSSLGIK